MLFVNILVLIGFFVFHLCTKYIIGFFVMILTANYINFLGFNILARNLKTPEGPDLKRRTNPFFYLMNVLYPLVILLVAFSPLFAPRCTATKVYPTALTLA
jgi:hypothetical protein